MFKILLKNKDIVRFYSKRSSWSILGRTSSAWVVDHDPDLMTRARLQRRETTLHYRWQLVGGWSCVKYQCNWIIYVHQCIGEYLKSNKILTTCHEKPHYTFWMNYRNHNINIFLMQFCRHLLCASDKFQCFQTFHKIYFNFRKCFCKYFWLIIWFFHINLSAVLRLCESGWKLINRNSYAIKKDSFWIAERDEQYSDEEDHFLLPGHR